MIETDRARRIDADVAVKKVVRLLAQIKRRFFYTMKKRGAQRSSEQASSNTAYTLLRS
jgi:hypothetical protein